MVMSNAEGAGSRGGGSALFHEYIGHPGSWWPAPAQRQARKIEGRVERLSRHRQLTAAGLVDEFIAMATLRRRYRRPTIYLSNVGSSGSHWLETLMMAAGGMLGAGEVYLPALLRKRLASMPLREQALFVDALHLLHARAAPPAFLHANAINSCHSQGIDHFTRSEPECVQVLLVRDPLDICLSRTFRKDEYRQAVASDETDEQYLDRNILFIQKFFDWAGTQDFALVVRFEALKEDPHGVVRGICKVARATVDNDALDAAVRDHDADRIREVGTTAPSNLYRGEQRPIPQALKAIAEERLSDVRGRYGYA